MRTSSRSSLLLTAALLAPAPLTAQAALPDGRAVIDRFIAAIGGREAVLAQSGRHVVGRFEVPAQGLGGDLEVYAAPPNKLRVRVTLPGFGEVSTGFDGTTAWAVNPAMGPMVLEGLQLAQMRHQADVYNSLYGPETIVELETVAEEPFEGQQAYKVRVKTTWGEEYFEYFHTSTGLQLGSLRTQASPMGDVETTSVVSEWKQVEGVLIPFRSVQRMMGMEQVVLLTEVRPTEVPDSVFALPAEIKALVGK